MRNLVHFGAALILLPLAPSMAFAADIPMSTWSEAKPSVAAPQARAVSSMGGQCGGYLTGGPVTDAMLDVMHDAGCCDYLTAMDPGQRYAILEDRLMCEEYQDYQDEHGVPPASLDVIAQPNPPPPAVVAPVAPVPDPVVVAPVPDPVVVAPVEAAPIEIPGDPPQQQVEAPPEEFNINGTPAEPEAEAAPEESFEYEIY